MTPKQILDSFSETLMRDERILSASERALLTTLLQHAKTASGEDHQTRDAVRTVITSAVGETVAQRAFAVLGSSIVERILEGSSLSTADSALRTAEFLGAPNNPAEPQHPGVKAPPATEPQHPGVKRPEPQHPGVKSPPAIEPQHPGVKAPPTTEPQHPGVRRPEPQHPGVRRSEPQHPGVKVPEPQHPGMTTNTKVVAQTDVAVAERPEILPGRCVVLDEFLTPQELAELTRFTLEHETDFESSEVVSPSHDEGVVNYDHRRSRVLMDLGQHQNVMLERIKTVLPQILQKLGMQAFSIAQVEAQITASNDGDYFHFHSDNGSGQVASRYLTFVYFFHREPKQFEGGDLRIHDSRLDRGMYVSEGSYQTIVPQQNQIVFFPCEMLHEITPVECASQRFADSRFTLNGWLRR
jgi:SM-20-related protein